MKNIFLKSIILIGVFLTSFFLPAWIVAALLICALFFIVKNNISQQDRKFVLTVLFAAITLKIIMVVVYYYWWILPGNLDVIGPDGEGFSQLGWYISRVLKNNVTYNVPTNEYVFHRYFAVVDYYRGKLIPFHTGSIGLFTWIIALVYYLAGYAPLLAKGLNIFVSAISAVLLFKISVQVTEKYIAKKALIIFTFFPSLFIFSITLLRDPFIVCCVLAVIYSLVMLINQIRLRYFLYLLLSLTAILFLRQEFFLVMALIVSLTLFLNRRIKISTKAMTFSLIVILVLISIKLSIFSVIKYDPIKFIKKSPAIIFRRNANLYKEGGRLVYRIFPKRYYEIYGKYDSEEYIDSDERITFNEFIKYVPKGVLFYFLRPFPFLKSNNIVGLCLFLYSLCWYTVLVLALIGIFRVRFRNAYPIFIFLSLFILITSMADANEGILIRHRDAIAPFFIIFAAAGMQTFVNYFAKRK